MSKGSGVILSSLENESEEYAMVLTAWHVLSSVDKKTGEVRLPDSIMLSPIHEPPEEPSWIKAVEADLSCFDARQDLALLLLRKDQATDRFGFEEWPGATISSRDPSIGSFVWGVGNHSSHDRIVSYGVVSGYTECEGCKNPFMVITDSSAWHGGSGGGIFDARGLLTGLLLQTRDSTKWAYHVPASQIRRFMRRCGEQGGVSHGAGQVEVTDPPGPNFGEKIWCVDGSLSHPCILPKDEDKIDLIGTSCGEAMSCMSACIAQLGSDDMESCHLQCRDRVGEKGVRLFERLILCLDKNCPRPKDGSGDPKKHKECSLLACSEELKACKEP